MAANGAAPKLASSIKNGIVPLVIAGKDVEGSVVFPVTNPQTGKDVWKVAAATAKEAAQAADAAQAAFPAWAKTKPQVRREIFLRAAQLFDERIDELSSYQVEETAADPDFVPFTVTLTRDYLKEWAGKAFLVGGTFPPSEDEGRAAIVLKEPYGVILAISPWNSPYPLGVRSVAPALIAGNTCVLKGPELSPRTYHAIVSIFKEAGLPDGVLNLVFHKREDAAQVTEALIAHPAVKKVNFTGSTAVGRIVATVAAQNLKPVVTELGGKASAIILADADLKRAAAACAQGSFMHTGQTCMSTDRIIVHESVVDDFITVFKEATDSVYGKATMTAVNALGANKNKRLVKLAIDGGAKVLYGDAKEAASWTENSTDTNMKPIILTNVPKGSAIHEDENFGPSVVIYTFKEEQEAIDIANDTIYGLAGAVFTQDFTSGLRIARAYETGAVHINEMTFHDESNLPHGGTKASGWGRFSSLQGLDEYLRTKVVTFDG